MFINIVPFIVELNFKRLLNLGPYPYKMYRVKSISFISNQICRELQKQCSADINRLNYSTKPGFFSKFIDNLKHEMSKNKEMKENIQKFREEAQKLEQSDALKTARMKFNAVESEAQKSSDVLKGKIGIIKDKVQDVMEEAGKTDIARKASQVGEELSKSAKNVTDAIGEKGQQFAKSGAFQTITQTTEIIKKEIGSQSISGRVYQKPGKLRKRNEISEFKPVEVNLKDTGIELHKDSKFYASWEEFKNNNAYVNKVLDWKMKYDESENPVIRASRILTDKVSDVMGNLFSKTELSETLTEICKIDQDFEQKQFLRDCETDIIPNILESMITGNLDILKDWCFESTYNIISEPIKHAFKMGYVLDSKVLDIENIDLAMGKVMEQGPVLIITFQTQQIMCVRDRNNNVIEGDPEKVMRVNYVWVLCRDMNEVNPKAAWRLMELSASSQEQLV